MLIPRPTSPLALGHTLLALADRPRRHRRRSELDRTYAPPADAWWTADDRWFPEDSPPRQGNRLLPLVDGETAMAAMYEAMASATESIHIAAWFLTPELRMIRTPDNPLEPRDGSGGPTAFLPLIARKADEVDVRILLWPGSGVGKFSTRRVKAMHRLLVRSNPRLRARLDNREHFSHCQHQKALVIDGRLAFVGGLDVTAFDADRWDVRQHSYRDGLNWHDTHWRLEGPCVADVATNFRQRWNAVAPRDPVRPAAPPEPIDGGSEAQVQRTIPKGNYPFAPQGIFGIAYAYRRAIARAERYIYLENQYLWSPEITEALCEAIQRGRRTGLRVALVLPVHPNVGKGDTDRHVQELLDADEGHGVFRAYGLYTSWHDPEEDCYKYRTVYVHAKVGIIDDTWVTVGSANLNGRGMATDSEINVTTTDPAVARALRLTLWAEHLRRPEGVLAGIDPATLLGGEWERVAAAQAATVEARSGLLTAAVYPYPLGVVDADFGPGEIESALLDK